jgi:hypothetical protein
MLSLPHWNRLRGVRLSRAIGFTLFLGLIPAVAQAPDAHPKPTELVIRRYEKLIASGALLTPDGWKRASRLFEGSDPYPRTGEIKVVSTGGSVGENWTRGDDAEVETKWNDFYGTIDAVLRYKPGPYDGSIIMGQIFPMVRTHPELGTDEQNKATGLTRPGEWKIKATQRVRFATIPGAIQYVEGIRDQSKDPVIRENARKTIAALKRLRHGCGSASAC